MCPVNCANSFVLPKQFALLQEKFRREADEREHVEKAPQELEINMLRCIYGYCHVKCALRKQFFCKTSTPHLVILGMK